MVGDPAGDYKKVTNMARPNTVFNGQTGPLNGANKTNTFALFTRPWLTLERKLKLNGVTNGTPRGQRYRNKRKRLREIIYIYINRDRERESE